MPPWCKPRAFGSANPKDSKPGISRACPLSHGTLHFPLSGRPSGV